MTTGGRSGWRQSGPFPLADEVPVALSYAGVTQAVMMATPDDIEAFLLGFALTEGIIASPGQLIRHEIVDLDRGIEARGWLAPEAGNAFRERRRAMMGPVGCGLCGIDSIAQALREVPAIATNSLRLDASAPCKALEALRACQPLQDKVRATHAAGLWTSDNGLVATAEDVGRHNALDKLAGKLKGDASGGALVVTSRLSVDLVQKAAMLGAEVLIGAGAATALAVDEADRCNLTLIGRASAQECQIYTHPERLLEEA